METPYKIQKLKEAYPGISCCEGFSLFFVRNLSFMRNRENELGFQGVIWSSKQKFEEIDNLGPIAQSVEQRTFNPWVDGSSPSGPTSYIDSRRFLI